MLPRASDNNGRRGGGRAGAEVRRELGRVARVTPRNACGLRRHAPVPAPAAGVCGGFCQEAGRQGTHARGMAHTLRFSAAGVGIARLAISRGVGGVPQAPHACPGDRGPAPHRPAGLRAHARMPCHVMCVCWCCCCCRCAPAFARRLLPHAATQACSEECRRPEAAGRLCQQGGGSAALLAWAGCSAALGGVLLRRAGAGAWQRNMPTLTQRRHIQPQVIRMAPCLAPDLPWLLCAAASDHSLPCPPPALCVQFFFAGLNFAVLQHITSYLSECDLGQRDQSSGAKARCSIMLHIVACRPCAGSAVCAFRRPPGCRCCCCGCCMPLILGRLSTACGCRTMGHTGYEKAGADEVILQAGELTDRM